MGSVVLFIIISLLIKRGMTDSHGFSDLGKVFGTIALIAFLVSLFAHPLLLVLGGVGIIAAIIAIVNRVSNSQRTDISRAHAEEFQQMYNEVYDMELKKFQSQHGEKYDKCNMTERKAWDLEDERRARESAARFVNEQVRKKYGQTAAAPAGHQRPAANTQARPAASQGQAPAGAYVPAPGRQSAARPQTPKPIKSSILPKAMGRRTKIVNKFNEQHNLYLTDEQVKRIVAASYMSNAWKQEVEAMYAKYDSVYQWLVGDTAFLRAYLRAFAVQDVSSDFEQQIKIVTESFEEIFEYSDSISGLTLERRIEMINSKFLTNFDDITYMIAYRYLESLGFHHELEKTQLNRIDGTFDDLVAKYDRMSTEAVDADLAAVPQSSPDIPAGGGTAAGAGGAG